MVEWKLQVNSGADQNIDELNIMNMSLDVVNRQQDDLSITIPWQQDGLFAYGDKVKLFKDDIVFFQGICATPKYNFDPDSENIAITINGLWSQLAKKKDVSSNYNQQTESTTTNSNTRTYANQLRLLNGDVERYTTRQFLIQVLEDAQDNGVEFDIGGVMLNDYEGFSWSKTNANVLEMINIILDLHPEYSAYIDYSGENPKLYIDKIENLPKYDFQLQGPQDVHMDITERRDLIPSCVTVTSLAREYDIENLTDVISKVPLKGNTWVVTQRFTIDENSIRECVNINFLPPALTQSTSVETDSTPQIGQSQRIKTTRYPKKFNENLGNLSTKKWWARNIQFIYQLEKLKGVVFDPESLVIAHEDVDVKDGYGKVTHIVAHKAELIDEFANDPDSKFRDRKANDMRPDNVEEVPNQLLAGSIEEWMENSAKIGTVKVTASVGVRSSFIAAIKDRKLKQQFLDTFPIVCVRGGTSYNFNTFSRQLQATNLNTGTYYAAALPKTVDDSQDDDIDYTKYLDQMGGLRYSAKMYVDYLRKLTPWQGSMSFIDEDIYPVVLSGNGINIIGGKPEWETINAPIERVTYVFQTGETQLSFGLDSIDDFDRSLVEPKTPKPNYNTSTYGSIDDNMNYIAGQFATPEAAVEQLPPAAPITGPACLSLANGFWDDGIFKAFFSTGKMLETNPYVRGQFEHDIEVSGSTVYQLMESASETHNNFFELSPNETTHFYLKWNTDRYGKISGKVELVKDKPQESVHYIVPSPNGISKEGKFYCEVYEIKTKNLGANPICKPVNPIPVWSSYAWEGKNIGGYSEVYDKYEIGEYKHHFRTIGPKDTIPEDGEQFLVNVEQQEQALIIKAGIDNKIEGSLTFVNCDNEEIAKIEWKHGRITTEGHQKVQVKGCNCDVTCESTI